MAIRIDPTLITPPTGGGGGTPPVLPPPPVGNGALALHTATPSAANPSQEYINVLLSAAINSRPDNSVVLPRFQTSNLPSVLAASSIRFRMSWTADAGFLPDTHVFGRYVIRHNLPSNYTVQSVDYAPLSGSTNTRMIIDVIEVREWRIDIFGPQGPMPEGWFIECVKLSNEAAYDNTALPRSHPSRVFVPEFLTDLAKWKPVQKRFMKAMATENGTIIDYYPDIEGLYSAQYSSGGGWIYPRDVMVSLCNEFDIEPWFNLGAGSTDELVTSFATYVRDNLKQSLSVVAGCSNEYWNIVYNNSCNRYLWAEAWRKFKPKGQGTVTLDKAARTATFTGAPDIRTFRPGTRVVNVRIGRYVFGLDMDGSANYPAATANVAHIFSGINDEHLFDATDVEYWYDTDGRNLLDEGYIMTATRQQKIWSDVFEAAGQRGRLVNVWESQLASAGRFTRLRDSSWWQPFSDYIDPRTVFDAVAINPYFGNGSFSSTGRSETELGADGRGLLLDNAFTAYIRPFAIADNYPAYSRAIRDFMLDRPIPGVPLSARSITTYLRNAAKNWHDTIAPYPNTATGRKMRLLSYEGGWHIIHSVLEPANRVSDNDIVDAYFFGFMQSDEATEVVREWGDLHVRYFDGPLMQFNFVGGISRFGAYGLIPFFGGPSDSRQDFILANYVDRESWWTEATAPQAPAVPAQVWTAGINPDFTLDDWVSNNATTFGGTPPAGMTLNTTTGALTGTPTASAAADYTFTAANNEGSIDVVINITVV